MFALWEGMLAPECYNQRTNMRAQRDRRQVTSAPSLIDAFLNVDKKSEIVKISHTYIEL